MSTFSHRRLGFVLRFLCRPAPPGPVAAPQPTLYDRGRVVGPPYLGTSANGTLLLAPAPSMLRHLQLSLVAALLVSCASAPTATSPTSLPSTPAAPERPHAEDSPHASPAP